MTPGVVSARETTSFLSISHAQCGETRVPLINGERVSIEELEKVADQFTQVEPKMQQLSVVIAALSATADEAVPCLVVCSSDDGKGHKPRKADRDQLHSAFCETLLKALCFAGKERMVCVVAQVTERGKEQPLLPLLFAISLKEGQMTRVLPEKKPQGEVAGMFQSTKQFQSLVFSCAQQCKGRVKDVKLRLPKPPGWLGVYHALLVMMQGGPLSTIPTAMVQPIDIKEKYARTEQRVRTLWKLEPNSPLPSKREIEDSLLIAQGAIDGLRGLEGIQNSPHAGEEVKVLLKQATNTVLCSSLRELQTCKQGLVLQNMLDTLATLSRLKTQERATLYHRVLFCLNQYASDTHSLCKN